MGVVRIPGVDGLLAVCWCSSACCLVVGLVLQVWRVRNYNSTAVEYTLRVTACVNAAFSRPKECVVITLPGNTANNDLIRCIKVRHGDAA